MIVDRITDQQVIEADRFDLRPLRRSDAGLIELYAGDKRVAHSTSSIPHPIPPGLTENFIIRSTAPNRVEDVWVIDGTKSGLGEVLGCIAERRMERNQAEIGYWVAPVFWNSGIASAAVKKLIEVNPQKSTTIFATVFQDNAASARVLTNAGFNYLGDAETYCVSLNKTVPTWTYSLNLKP